MLVTVLLAGTGQAPLGDMGEVHCRPPGRTARVVREACGARGGPVLCVSDRAAAAS
ncbi:hypothetical protein GCM10028771_09100 [Nocardioides marmoraquaticus]